MSPKTGINCSVTIANIHGIGNMKSFAAKIGILQTIGKYNV